MKPPLRIKSFGTKVSEAEFALLEERARGAGMRLADTNRPQNVLLLAAVLAAKQRPNPARNRHRNMHRISPQIFR